MPRPVKPPITSQCASPPLSYITLRHTRGTASIEHVAIVVLPRFKWHRVSGSDNFLVCQCAF